MLLLLPERSSDNPGKSLDDNDQALGARDFYIAATEWRLKWILQKLVVFYFE